MNQFTKKNKNRIIVCLLIICLLLSQTGVLADGETLPEVGTPTGTFAPEESTEASTPEETEPAEAETDPAETEPAETEDSSEPTKETTPAPTPVEIDPNLAPVYDYLKLKEQQGADQQVIDVINEHKEETQSTAADYEAELLRNARLRKQAELSELNSIVFRGDGFVNVRVSPEAEADIVGRMRYNATATVLDTVYADDGTWYHIQSGEVQGYVKAEFFESGYAAVEIISSITVGFARIINDAQRLYREESTESDTLTYLEADKKYQMVSWNDSFVRILYAAGEYGTVYGFVPRDSVTTSWETPKAVTIEAEERSWQDSYRIIQEMARIDQSRDESRMEAARAWESSSLQESIEASIAASIAEFEAWLEASRIAESESIRAMEESIRASIQAVEDESRRVEESIRAAEESRVKESSWLKAQEESKAEASRRAAEESAAAEARWRAAEESRRAAEEAAAAAAAAESRRRAEADASRAAQQWYNVNDYSRFMPAGTSDLRRNIVKNALQYVGILDYVFGGYSLSGGTDCSGFVSLIYGQYGIDLAHYSYYIAYSGVPVMSINQARPGDIVCWRTWDAGTGQGHVAIFIGWNEAGTPMIVEAPREGLKVRVMEMPTEGLHTIRNVLGD